MLVSSQNLNGSKVTTGALVIALFSILSRLVGLLRDRLLAGTFGAGGVLDAYYAAFKIPDFIFNTFVLGALAAALIPVFIQYRTQKGLASSFALVNRVLNLLVIILALAAIIGIITAPGLMSLIAPGFTQEFLALATSLSRIMLLAVVIFGLANIMGSVLQAQHRLTAFAAAPVLYNVGIIAGLFLFVPVWGPVGLGWGVVLGSLLHLLVQLPVVVNLGWRWRAQLSFADAGLRQVLSLLGPRTLGLMAGQINQIITVSFVSSLAVGSLAAFSLAINLHSFPINVFGVSLAVAVFPLLSQAFTTRNHQEFVHHFSQNLRRVLFYVLPLSVLFLVLRAQLVRVVLGSGAFDWTDTIRTAQALGFLAMAIVSDSILPLVARAFYALQDTKTPVVAAVISIIINLALLIVLKPYGLAGVGIAYVSSSLTNLIILMAILGKKLGYLGSDFVIAGAWRMTAAAAAAAAAAYGTLYLVAPYVNMNTFIGIGLQGSLAGLIGLISYLVISTALSLPEVAFARRWLTGAWRLLARL